ncbi:M20/M25/M40 family metallo-hydrolase [Ferroglobus sp.]|uniref:M20 family metallopeptidase n=1 Tax=Ferroglobus sp. TaxID=2614230 RepID=UPI0025C1C335|nr:M20/M25/M40 family metallo-hydrolase [Ferroglobus sp.]
MRSQSSSIALRVLEELIKIDTRNPPGRTSEAVEFLENIFSSHTTKIYEAEEGKENLVVEIAKGKPSLMFNSHLDTVPAKDILLTPVFVDGRVYGRGSCDAKGCVAAIVEAFLNFEPEIGLKLSFTADEEVGGKLGLDYVLEREKADYVIVSEPFGSDSIGVAQAKVYSIDIIVKGNSGHTASADVKSGAIYKASKLIVDAVDYFSSIEEKNLDSLQKLLGTPVEIRGRGVAAFNPAIIEGGVKRNVVADKCVIKADVRLMPWVDEAKVFSKIAGGDVELVVQGVLKPYGLSFDGVDLNADLRFFEIIKSSIASFGLKPKATVSLGVGDIRHARKRGIPAFYLGPKGENLHADDEFVYVDEIFRVAKIYRRIAEKLAKFT